LRVRWPVTCTVSGCEHAVSCWTPSPLTSMIWGERPETW
jgi:hypothetical protein